MNKPKITPTGAVLSLCVLLFGGGLVARAVYPAASPTHRPPVTHATTTAQPHATSVTSTPVAGFTPAATAVLGNCHARGGLPDPNCTPGAILPTATVAAICVSGYSSTVRNVPASLAARVYASYGISSHTPGQYEVDHLVSLELGGSNEQANLWPELALPIPGYHQKDSLENELHAQVCSGALDLGTAQREIATNWIAAYTAYQQTLTPSP